MSGISKRDAMKLVEQIRQANVGGHAIAQRTGIGPAAVFLGGLESVLENFLFMQGCPEAAKALHPAMNDTPSAEEIAERNARIERLFAPPAPKAAP
jgi:hypothetical protein